MFRMRAYVGSLVALSPSINVFVFCISQAWFHLCVLGPSVGGIVIVGPCSCRGFCIVVVVVVVASLSWWFIFCVDVHLFMHAVC